MKKLAAFLCVCIALQLCGCGGGVIPEKETASESSSGAAETTAGRAVERTCDPTDLSDVTVIDNNTATVTVDSVSRLGERQYSFKISVHNNTGLSVYYTAWFYVCGYTLASSSWAVEEGETYTDELYVDLYAFAGGSLTDLDEISLDYLFEYTRAGGTAESLRAYGAVYPTGLGPDQVIYPDRTPEDTDVTVYEDPSYRVVYTGWEAGTETGGPGFYLENNTDSYRTLELTDYLINDWMISYSDMFPINVSLMPGGRVYAVGEIYNDTLERCGIEGADKLTLTVQDRDALTGESTFSERVTAFFGGGDGSSYQMSGHDMPEGAVTVYDTDVLFLAAERTEVLDGYIVIDLYMEHHTAEECCITANGLIVDGNGIETPYGLWTQTVPGICRASARILISDYDLAEFDMTAQDVRQLTMDIIYDNYHDEIDTVPLTIDLKA